jgi:hypothetical protein
MYRSRFTQKPILGHACQALDMASPKKTSFLYAKPTVSERRLYEGEALSRAAAAAKEIEALSDKADSLLATHPRLEAKIASLRPWISPGRAARLRGDRPDGFYVRLSAVLSRFFEEFSNQFSKQFPASHSIWKHDEEQHYITVLCPPKRFRRGHRMAQVKGLAPASLRETKECPGSD